MPADTIGNSISSFLNKTDQVSQKYRNVQLESEAADRFGRSSSVARATSVARQFEPSSSTFMRGGSVARGFEVIIDRDIVCNNLGVTNMLQTSSRDPFYSQISRPPTVTFCDSLCISLGRFVVVLSMCRTHQGFYAQQLQNFLLLAFLFAKPSGSLQNLYS